ncbi:MAG: ShlB/FhaC/HecB family hemolysin secretion/activation protein [Candidatus Omnitrophica bacterium]|nr:ShlB/FhaC/HecB family hemolysin secretion/activation protein [Candidatus Omnitrophota bacterium]
MAHRRSHWIPLIVLVIWSIASAGWAQGTADTETDKDEELVVQKIVTDHSEILPEEELQAVLRSYEGKQLSIYDLHEVVDEINALYRARNYVTARAMLLPQKVEDGVVKIKLVEGRLGRIEVEGNKYTRDSFFKRRISMRNGDVMDLKSLEKDLEFFNSTNDCKMRAELRAGEEPGTSDCILKVEEPKRWQASTFVDNAGRDDVGLYRIGALLSVNSLLGFRDRLSLATYYADGTTSGSVAYDIPITRKGTRIGASYDQNQIEVIGGDFSVLDIDGDSSDISAYISHPLIGRPRLVSTGFAEWHEKQTTTRFAGVPLVESGVSTVSGGFDLQAYDDHGMWYFRNELSFGSSDLENTEDFFRWTGDLSRFHLFKDDRTLILRASAQWANEDLLPSSEQFQIGGLSTVRGFDQGLLIGDKGYLMSAELNWPLFRKESKLRNKLKGAVFIDHGGAFPFKPGGEGIDSEDFLTSVGAGLVFNLSKYFNGRISYGFPLSDQESDKGEGQLHFYIQSNLF